MKAPIIYIVVRRDRDCGDLTVCWSFDKQEAETEARRLNDGIEYGAHIAEEVRPIGAVANQEI